MRASLRPSPRRHTHRLSTPISLSLPTTSSSQVVCRAASKASKIMMPLLFAILIVLAVYSLWMPDGREAIGNVFTPDFSKVSGKTFLDAMGQAFFTLSVGMGAMLIYGSYFKKGTKIAGTAISVVSLDTLVALIAAIIVFSAGVEGAAGPALAFVAMPSVFASMPWGNVWATLFFLLLALAALSSTISMHEAVTSYFVEKRGMSRKRGAWIVTILAMVLATFASLSLGVLDDVKVLNLNFFDLLDKFTSIVMLPLLGILTAVFVGWLWKKEDMRAELTAEGGIDRKSYPIVRFLLRWVCPLLVSVVFVFGIYDFVDKQLHPEQAERSATTEQVQEPDTDTKLIVNSQSNVLRVGKERLKASDLNSVHANKANFKQAELEFTPISVKQQNNNNNN